MFVLWLSRISAMVQRWLSQAAEPLDVICLSAPQKVMVVLLAGAASEPG